MIKKILELLQQKMEVEQKLDSWKFDHNTVLDRIKLLRKKWEIIGELNLYTPEEIFTAVNYKVLKRHMEKRKLRKVLMVEDFEKEEEEEEKIIIAKRGDMSMEEIYIIFSLMFQRTIEKFLDLGLTITQSKLREHNDKKNIKLPIQNKN